MSKELKQQAAQLRKLASEIDHFIEQDKIREDFINRVRRNKEYRESVKKRKVVPLVRTTRKLHESDIRNMKGKYREAIARSLKIKWTDPHKLHGTMTTVFRTTMLGKIEVYKYYFFMMEFLIPGAYNREHAPATTCANDQWVYKLIRIKE